MALRRSGVISCVIVLASLTALASGHLVAAPPSDERTISFYHIHTQERLTVTYKKGGQYIPEAMKKIDWIMRDWRKNEAIKIDPATIDLAWEMYQELGSKEAIQIICGYRSAGTNSMLRRTQGGQASNSQHITGRAIDITFPDVPLKRMRYSALVRERGGVGYYPTSGIPFVHIDTARVRAWPRLPRYELALVFPSGHTKHMPADGGPITPEDVKVAKSKNKELAIQVAEFHELRLAPRKAVISIAAKLPSLKSPPKPAERITLASLPAGGEAVAAKPFAPARVTEAAALPEFKVEPKMATAKSAQVAAADQTERAFVPKAVLSADRGKLDKLVAEAASMPMPKLVAEPKPAVRPQKALAAVAKLDQPESAAPALPVKRMASLDPTAVPSITDMSPETPGNGWVQAPEFDEDHPEELAYRPFPLAPLLTETPSAHDPVLSGLTHPDVAATLDALDDMDAAPPMRFRSGQQVVQVMWAQQFEGKAVHLEALSELERGRAPQGLANRAVKTSVR